MSSCVECFFYSGLTGKALQIFADQEHPNFACEAEVCSPHSPAPVADEEKLALLIIDPTHIDKTRGEITPDAFGELTKRDLSVLRVRHATRAEAEATREELVQRGAQKTPPELRLVDEVCIARAERIRGARIDGTRILAVYDTALEGKPAHASVFTNELGLTSGKRMRKQIREACYSVFRDVIVSYDEFARQLS
ncbi:MAG: hypothetical protein HOP95_12725 [Sphingomonas sp.]|nr:hypothetical protein [Sphingomonas sp.]